MHERGLVIAPLRVETWALRAGEHRLRVLRCGMGAAHAREAADRIRFDPAPVVAVCGLCSALDADCLPGDLVVPDRLQIDDHSTRVMAADRLRGLLAAQGWRVHGGTLLGVDRIVVGAERMALRESGANALDMESAWLAAGAGARPFVVMRVVVDGPSAELYRIGTLTRGWRALNRLRRASAVLGAWAESAAQDARA